MFVLRLAMRGFVAATLCLSGVLAAGSPDETFYSANLGGLTAFEVNGHHAFLLTPKTRPIHQGEPWVWFAPTLLQKDTPSAPNRYLFDELLKRGVQVAGVDVGESYGSPEGSKLYSTFYRIAIEKYHLSAKPCLLAQSRGGLMLYNWAADNAEAVRCIGGIFPVTDLRTWPLSTDSRPQFEEAMTAYGMTATEFNKHLEEFSPVSHLSTLAHQNVAILHLHGDSDRWVPFLPNSCELKKRYSALGGDAKIEVIKGKGHEPASEFFQSCDLLAFLLLHLTPDEASLQCPKTDLAQCP